MAVVETDERYLVECHRAGDPEAFGRIFRHYYPGLLAHAQRRLFDPQAAEDAVQETLLRAYRALPRFNGQYRLGGWLHRILVNVCIDEGNRRRRQGDMVDRLGAVRSPDTAEPADLAIVPTDGTALTDALDDLPEPYREALVLRFVEERTYEEISQAVDISEDNARARVSRARAALRRVSTSGAAVLALLFGFLRRGQRAAAAAEMSGTVAHDAPARLAVTSSPIVAQLAPVAAEIGQSGGMVASKVALAIGVAAAVAVPTANVAIDRGTQAPPPAAASEPAPPARPDDPIRVTASASPLSLSTSEASTAPPVDPAAGPVSTLPAAGDHAGGAEASFTPGPGAADPGPVDGSQPPAGAGAAPAPGLTEATVRADALTLTAEGGDRLGLSGAFTITPGTGTVGAVLAPDSKVQVGPPDAADPARRSFEAVGLVLVLDDGRILSLTLVGSLTQIDGPVPVAPGVDGGSTGGSAGEPAQSASTSPFDGMSATFELTGMAFELEGGEEIGAIPSGGATGRLAVDGASAALEMTLAPPAETAPETAPEGGSG